MKRHQITLSIIIIVLLSIGLTSCQKEEEFTMPDYISLWQSLSDNSPLATRYIKTSLDLEENSFDLAVDMLSYEVALRMYSIKGNIEISTDRIKILPGAIGTYDPDTASLFWVEKDEDGWQDALARTGLQDPYEGSYEIVDNTLILSMDDSEEQIFYRFE